MKIFLLTAFAILIQTISAAAQCPQQLSFTTQAQINSFPVQYPGCDSIRSLTISGNDIIDLTPLLGIRHIVSEVNISNNPLLSNLKGLDSLHHGGSGFQIGNNISLTSLEGLGSLTVIDEFLGISNNPRLRNLKGLENLSYLLSFLITENDSLESVDGLESIVEGVWIDIESNPLLQNLQGLQNFEWGELTIGNNDKLINLSGLENVHTLGYLEIYGNENLQELTGLAILSDVFYGVNISGNPNLTECAIYYFCQDLFDPDQISELFNNGPSCSSIEDILSVCRSYAKGNVYLDLNCDQVFNTGDLLLRHHIIESVESSLPIAATDPNGGFIKFLFDNDTLNLRPRGLQGFSSNPASYEIITDTSHQIFDSLDFALCPDTLFYDLAVSLSDYELPRPGFHNSYRVCISNKGLYPTGANILFDFSNAASSEYVTIYSVEGSGVINGPTVTWSIPDIPIFNTFCLEVEIVLDAATPLGTLLFPHVIVTPIESVIEINLSNNEVVTEQSVIGSYDPNDKMVNPGFIEFSPGNHSLEYIIRFQNTGTAAATFIDVIDTLSAGIDMRSFEMIQSSHPYLLSFPDSNIIQWHFEDIYLPDSTTNEEESHGFVKFRINTFNDLNANTTVENKASIYFDFNAPVATNFATTTILSPCYGEFFFTRQSQIDSFQLFYPECDSLLTLHISGDDITDLSPFHKVKSVTGQLVISNNPLLKNLGGLENLEHVGYLFKIRDNLNLTSMQGLSSLKTLNAQLFIADNPRLKDLQGLESLVSLSNLTIVGNDSLTDLDAIENLTSAESVYIISNERLQNLGGLQNITNLIYLIVEGNDVLPDLKGLENIITVGELAINNNDNLESITGLENLQKINFILSFQYNSRLTDCAIDFFCDSLFTPHPSANRIAYNAPSCNSLEEVLASCTISNVVDANLPGRVSIFPNPCNGLFNLNFEGTLNAKGKIILKEANGIELMSESFDALTGDQYFRQFDLRQYPAGIYFLSIISNEGIVTKKVVSK